PEFISIIPIETGDVLKYVPSGQPDSYVTSETSVAFSGRFANVTDIKLLVRFVDENGNPNPKYDRRYGVNFGSREPATGNPLFFNSVSSTLNQFTTNEIALNNRGDTIFEFTITNGSQQTITRSISIRREPSTYSI